MAVSSLAETPFSAAVTVGVAFDYSSFAGAFGAGLAGVVVNSAHGGVVIAARALFAVFAAVGVLGALASRRAVRGLR